jgi:hypothetical protein
MPKLILLPEIEDINCFYNEDQNRSDNDENNKIRENIISNIFHVNANYFVDTEYGENIIEIEIGNKIYNVKEMNKNLAVEDA